MTEHSMVSTDEREALLGFLDHQRQGLRNALYGLTEDQARQAPSASALSVAGLIKHSAAVERNWVGLIRRAHQGADFATHMASFQAEDTPTEQLLDDYERAAQETEAAILAVETLNDPVPVPKDVPWFPKDIDAWTVRWVLVHLIEETARHAGHADIVRETVDGAQAVELVAAVEGWPENGFIKPWRKPAQD